MDNINKRDKIARLGHYTTNPHHFMKVLTPNEWALLECVRYFTECYGESKCISNSLILTETSIAKEHHLKALKVSLEKLGYIQRISENKKGTLYKVGYDTIVSDVKALNEERNTLERLRLADTIRIERGLEPINETKIKAFAGTSFDTDTAMSTRYEEAAEAKRTLEERVGKTTPKATEQTEVTTYGNTDKAANGIPTNTPRIDPAKFTYEEWVKLINYYIDRRENKLICAYEANMKTSKVLELAKQYGWTFDVPKNTNGDYIKMPSQNKDLNTQSK